VSEFTKGFCNRCGRDTNQEILHIHREKFRDKTLEELLREDEPDAEAWYTTLTELLKCRGCDGVTVRQRTSMSAVEEMSEDELRREFGEDWKDVFEIVYYPPVSARRKPKWMMPNSGSPRSIPDSVKQLMEEIYTALQNGSSRLVAMGTRAVLETIMTTETGDQGNFSKNMDGFQKAGYLSIRQRHSLEAILEAGHASIHRSWNPTGDDISTLMDITESVIETTYLHEPQARRLETKLPRRPPRRPSSTGLTGPGKPD
jgi:hypothetical protein